MNENLVELAIEANDETGNNFDLNYKPLDAFLANFAELIVKECMIIVKQEAMLTDYVPAKMNEYAGKRLYRAFAEIEKHFGVEE